MTLSTGSSNADQVEYWQSASGLKWVRHQEALDATMAEVAETLLKTAAPAPNEHVLDIGCGCGATTLMLGKAVGPEGLVTGLDISPPLLARAEERRSEAKATNITFQEGDAQVTDWGNERVDLITSRFGVMFFDDPVAAFSNLAKALKPGGRIAFVSWAALDKNPWFSVPREAAVARLDKPTPADPRAPGPLAFSEIDYVTGILRDAGLANIEAQEQEIPLVIPGTAQDAATLAGSIGPAARIMKEFSGTEDDLAAIVEAVRVAYATYETANGVRVPARLNVFSATAGT